jgi:ubiquinone/menaquinone biosynthesis C-methylase UbiE
MFSRSIVTVLAALSLACQGTSKLDFSHLSRATWQRPDDVVAALEIQPGQTVADLGAGEGYFIPYFSDAVGEAGRVYAVDVEEAIVDGLRENFGGDGSNVEPTLGKFEDPMLPDASIDLLVIVNTFHHIEDPATYFANLKSDLRAGGRVAVLEPNEELTGVLSWALDEGHTNTVANVREKMEAAGYREVASHDFLPVQIFEVFAPR